MEQSVLTSVTTECSLSFSPPTNCSEEPLKSCVLGAACQESVPRVAVAVVGRTPLSPLSGRGSSVLNTVLYARVAMSTVHPLVPSVMFVVESHSLVLLARPPDW